MKKVLVIRLSSLGDVVISTAVPYLLKDYFDIFFLTKKDYSDILEGIDYINLLRLESSSLRDVLKTASYIKSNIKPDYIIDLQDKISTILIRKFLDPKGEKTFVWNSQRFKRRKTVISKEFSGITHTVSRFLETAYRLLEREGINFKPENVLPQLVPPLRPDNLELLNLSDFVLIAPEAKRKTRMWNLFECRKLVDSLEKKGIKAVLVGKDRNLERFFENGTKFFGNISLKDLTYLVSKSVCVVSLDSAVSHIASALRVPTVVIFTSSHPEMGFYPLGAKVVMKENIRCRPCSVYGKDTCPAGHWLCTFVPYNEVEKKVIEILRESRKSANKVKETENFELNEFAQK